MSLPLDVNIAIKFLYGLSLYIHIGSGTRKSAIHVISCLRQLIPQIDWIILPEKSVTTPCFDVKKAFLSVKLQKQFGEVSEFDIQMLWWQCLWFILLLTWFNNSRTFRCNCYSCERQKWSDDLWWLIIWNKLGFMFTLHAPTIWELGLDSSYTCLDSWHAVGCTPYFTHGKYGLPYFPQGSLT